MKIDWKKETKPFMELLASILLSFILIIGFVYNFVKPLWDYRKLSIKGRFEAYMKWYEDMTIQTVYVVFYLLRKILKSIWYLVTLRIWKSIKHLFHEIARSIDLLGNVFAGELIEDLITPVEKTYYGLGKITISASTGYIVHLAKTDSKAINKTGLWLTRALNKSFNEEHHSLWAWEREIRDNPIFGKDDFLDSNI